jgi:hypothetical protein
MLRQLQLRGVSCGLEAEFGEVAERESTAALRRVLATKPTMQDLSCYILLSQRYDLGDAHVLLSDYIQGLLQTSPPNLDNR